MSITRYLFILTLAFTINAKAQINATAQKLNGKVFMSKKFKYIHFINDSLVYFTTPNNNDTAHFFITGDTLFLQHKYVEFDISGEKETNVVKLYHFRMLSFSGDTLTLKNNFEQFKNGWNYKDADWEDTLVLVNVERMKEPVDDFKYLSYELVNPHFGVHVSIDKEGNVIYAPILPILYKGDKDVNTTKGKLTSEEFDTFKGLLSKAVLSTLPPKHECLYQGNIMPIILEVMIGQKIYKTSGCVRLSKTQEIMESYVDRIKYNKNLIITQKPLIDTDSLNF